MFEGFSSVTRILFINGVLVFGVLVCFIFNIRGVQLESVQILGMKIKGLLGLFTDSVFANTILYRCSRFILIVYINIISLYLPHTPVVTCRYFITSFFSIVI